MWWIIEENCNVGVDGAANSDIPNPPASKLYFHILSEVTCGIPWSNVLLSLRYHNSWLGKSQLQTIWLSHHALPINDNIKFRQSITKEVRGSWTVIWNFLASLTSSTLTLLSNLKTNFNKFNKILLSTTFFQYEESHSSIALLQFEFKNMRLICAKLISFPKIFINNFEILHYISLRFHIMR